MILGFNTFLTENIYFLFNDFNISSVEKTIF